MRSITGKNGKEYVLEEIIGEGAFGKVYSSPPYAIKEIKLKSDAKARSILMNQISIMQKLSHPNIVSLLEVINESNSFFLVMEKCDMDLKKYLTKFRLSERKSVEILRQLLAGFSKLVEKGYIHRDLKPANILITSKLEFKLADFGMAKYVDHYDTALLQTLVGTPLYMSPQILMGQSYTTKCDIWSLGCIFYEMLTGVSPWTANTEQALLRNILNKPLAVPQGGSKWSTDLLQKMLMIKQEDRIGWEDIFKYMATYKKEDTQKNRNKSNAKIEEEKASITSVYKPEQLKLLFTLQLKQVFDKDTATRIANEANRQLTPEESQKVKGILELFTPDFQQYLKRGLLFY